MGRFNRVTLTVLVLGLISLKGCQRLVIDTERLNPVCERT